MIKTALVATQAALYNFDFLYTYIAEDFPELKPGCIVSVPFGNRKNNCFGIVFELSSAVNAEIDYNVIKKIAFVYDDIPTISEEQLNLIKWLKDYTFCTYFDAYKTVCPLDLNIPKRKSKTLTKKNSISIDFKENSNEIKLSSSQEIVFSDIKELLFTEKPECALLRGVTGSGKTEIFIKLISTVLSRGKNAILLVPEIALTPQMSEKFKNIFGELLAVIHSGITLAAKKKENKRIKSGEVRIVIGARSAIFVPLSNIGIVIIDEENENSYKSDRTPRYHARDAAKQRVFYHNALLVLASATPSIESYYYAKIGRYKLFELTERFGNAVLPKVTIVDMKLTKAFGKYGMSSENFSRPLLTEIGSNLEKGEQTLILLNRRGYNTYLTCEKCSKPIVCPVCLLPMTYHISVNEIRCHYCGGNLPLPSACPECFGTIIRSGTGTQKAVEELTLELEKLFSGVRIIRADADVINKKSDYEKIFTAFQSGEYDIMIGTQMIAKGLDFPNVTLVGVLLIDKILFSANYKSYERTFSLLTQVVGRAGRAGNSIGRAYIQTFVPDHFIINLASEQDYVKFYREEIKSRELLGYPPVFDIFSIIFAHEEEKIAIDSAISFIKELSITAEETEIVTGIKPLYLAFSPVKTEAGRIMGKYKYTLNIKAKNNKFFRQILSATLIKVNNLAKGNGVTISIDVNI